MYTVNTFIDTSNNGGPNQIILKLVNSNATISHLVNVCKYQKLALKDKTLALVLRNFTEPITMEFTTRQEAITAQSLLSDIIYTLKANCQDGGIIPGPSNYDGPITIRVNDQISGYSWTSSSNPFVIPPQYDITNNKVDLFLNGQKLVRDTDYILNGRNLEFIYIGPGDATVANCGYSVCVEATDLLEIIIH